MIETRFNCWVKKWSTFWIWQTQIPMPQKLGQVLAQTLRKRCERRIPTRYPAWDRCSLPGSPSERSYRDMPDRFTPMPGTKFAVVKHHVHPLRHRTPSLRNRRVSGCSQFNGVLECLYVGMTSKSTTNDSTGTSMAPSVKGWSFGRNREKSMVCTSDPVYTSTCPSTEAEPQPGSWKGPDPWPSQAAVCGLVQLIYSYLYPYPFYSLTKITWPLWYRRFVAPA